MLGMGCFLAHLRLRLIGELIVYTCSGIRPSSVVLHIFKNEYLCNQWANHSEILSEASLGWGKAALGFGPDRLKNLVSMATDSPIGENGVATFSQLILIRSFLYLQATMTCMGARRSSKFSQIRPPTADLAALERLKKSPLTYNGKNGVATFSWLFLIGSITYLQVAMTYMRAWMSLKFGQIRLLVSMAKDRVIIEITVLPLFLVFFFIRSFSYLQVMVTCMRARRSSKFGQIRPLTAELAALERLKKSPWTYNGKKWCCQFFSAVLDRIHFILAGNDDIRYDELDEFEIWPDPTTGFHGNRVIREKRCCHFFSAVFH